MAVPPYGTIYLDGLPYKVPHEEYANLATLLGKVTFGDFTRDSDQIMSAKIWTSLIGGIGVERLREGSDDNRYWFGSLDVTRPFQFGLNEEVLTITGNGALRILGELDGNVYFADDKEIVAWNEATLTFGSKVDDLDDVPVYRGWEFNGKLFIPQGAHGFQSFDGTTADTQNTTVQAICFAEWDDKLYALTEDRKLYSSLDGSTWVERATIKQKGEPRRLILYMDTSGDDVLYIVTSKGILAWDELSSKVVTTRLGDLPAHPDNGLGVAMWRPGEDLYVSAGQHVYRWTINAAVPNAGPARDEGLPVEYRGKIVDMVPGLNALYALTQGSSEVAPYEPGVELDPGQLAEPEFEVRLTDPNNLVLQWTGYGWQPVHVPAASGEAHWMEITESPYRLWWCIGDNAYSVKLSPQVMGLRQRTLAGEGRYQRTGFADLGWFDAGMLMYDKLASHLEVTADRFDPSVHTLSLEARLAGPQGIGPWFHLGGMDGSGFSVLPFGVELLPDGTLFSYGEPFRRIRLRLSGSTRDLTDTFIIDSITLKFIKLPLSVGQWTYTVNIDTDSQYDRSALEIKEALDSYASHPRFARLEHGGATQTSHRVYVSRVTGNNETGHNPAGFRTITLIGMPLPGFEGEVPGVIAAGAEDGPA